LAKRKGPPRPHTNMNLGGKTNNIEHYEKKLAKRKGPPRPHTRTTYTLKCRTRAQTKSPRAEKIY